MQGRCVSGGRSQLGPQKPAEWHHPRLHHLLERETHIHLGLLQVSYRKKSPFFIEAAMLLVESTSLNPFIAASVMGVVRYKSAAERQAEICDQL